jgi:hypothetical protein
MNDWESVYNEAQPPMGVVVAYIESLDGWDVFDFPCPCHICRDRGDGRAVMMRQASEGRTACLHGDLTGRVPLSSFKDMLGQMKMSAQEVFEGMFKMQTEHICQDCAGDHIHDDEDDGDTFDGQKSRYST